MARVVYSWIPVKERGLVKGINFSGSRIGAALAMPGVAWLIHQIGWHKAFLVLMLVGFAWAAFWWLWFRDEPEQHKTISRANSISSSPAVRTAARTARSPSRCAWEKCSRPAISG